MGHRALPWPAAVLPKPNPEHLIVVPEEKDAVAGIERGGGAVFRTAGHATEVFFTGPNFDDAEMELVGKLPMIAQFTARMVAFTDRGMAALSKLHKLESIEIQSDKITNAGIDCLRGLRNVKKLTLNCPRLTDDGLKALSGMERLEELKVTSNRVLGPGLKHLAGLSSLRSLSLCCPVTSDALGPLGRLVNLETLNVLIDDAALKYLSSLKNLPRSISRTLPTRAVRTW